MNYIEYNESDIQNFEYETTINSDGNIAGTCELGKATIQMLNDSNEYSSLKGSWMQTIHGSFYIHEVTPVQEKVNIKLECYDIKYKLDKKYDSSKHTFPCSLKEWRNSIFDDCEVKYDNSDFPNSDLLLQKEPYIGDKPSNRNVICQIAQAGLSFVTTDEKDKFYFKWFENTVHIADDWSSLTTEKEHSQAVNVMVLGRGEVEDNVKWPEILPNNSAEFRIDNNYILDSQEIESDDQRYNVIQSLYDRINGFSYIIFSVTTQNIENKLSVKLGEKIKYVDIWDNELESYIMSKKIVYLGGNLSNDDNYQIILSAEQINETATELSYSSSIKNDILKVERKADKANGKIEDIIEQTDEATQKLSQITLDINSIRESVSKFTNQSETISKLEIDIEKIKSSIGNITDTTTSSQGIGTVEMKKVMNSEILYLQIYPTNRDLSLLYPDNNLYPSNELYPTSRDLIFQSETDTYTFTLPCDLLFLNNNIKDEFILNHETKEMYKIQRVGIDADGNKYALAEVQTQYFVYQPFVIEKNGDYSVKMLSFNDAYIYVRTLAQNLLTSQYATKVELNSAIELTKQSITQSVAGQITLIDGTVKDLSASLKLKLNTNDLISEINASADEINLTSNRFSMTSKYATIDKEGAVQFKKGEIGGWNITDDRLTNGNVFIRSDGASTIYTVADLIIIRNSIMGVEGFELSPNMIKHYDLDGDGIVGATDYAKLQKLIGISMN